MMSNTQGQRMVTFNVYLPHGEKAIGLESASEACDMVWTETGCSVGITDRINLHCGRKTILGIYSDASRINRVATITRVTRKGN